MSSYDAHDVDVTLGWVEGHSQVVAELHGLLSSTTVSSSVLTG